MSSFPTESKASLRRHRAEQSISLALQSRWQEAARVNEEIIELFPDDVEAHNRLGRARFELGQYAEAAAAYRRAVELDPSNAIARRNLDRLAHIEEVPSDTRPIPDRIAPELFIEETGKTGMSELAQPASQEVLANMNPGEVVQLRASGRDLVVESVRGEYLGQLEPRLALRLLRLMEGGNRYAAAVASVDGTGGKVIIKEVYHDPSQMGRRSFPSRAAAGFRPYTRDTLLRYELEEEPLEEGEEPGEWEEETKGFTEVVLDETGETVVEDEEEEEIE